MGSDVFRLTRKDKDTRNISMGTPVNKGFLLLDFTYFIEKMD